MKQLEWALIYGGAYETEWALIYGGAYETEWALIYGGAYETVRMGFDLWRGIWNRMALIYGGAFARPEATEFDLQYVKILKQTGASTQRTRGTKPC